MYAPDILHDASHPHDILNQKWYSVRILNTSQWDKNLKKKINRADNATNIDFARQKIINKLFFEKL